MKTVMIIYENYLDINNKIHNICKQSSVEEAEGFIRYLDKLIGGSYE